MVIEIKNFGPISHLKFDISKDIHLIYGENAIGKSYATYCIYCLLKNIKNKVSNRRFYYVDDEKDDPLLKHIGAALTNLKGNKHLDLTKIFEDLIHTQLERAIIKGLQNSLLNTFSSLKNLKNRYSKKDFELIVNISQEEKLHIYYDNKESLNLKYVGKITKVQLTQKTTRSTKYSLYINDKMEFGKPTEEEFKLSFLSNTIYEANKILNYLDFNIRDIYYLPASRSGLYQALNAFTPIIAELTQSRFFIQNKSIELPSLSEPLSDYFIDLSTVDKKHINKEFSGIIKLLENDILNGEVEYNEKTKRIVYKPKNINLELNLSEASSMVAELSPLVLYFKHIINYKYSSNKDSYYNLFDRFHHNQRNKKDRGFDILFIEEPEAHLHPEVQVKLIEVFVKLSQMNIKIFITSHSNYMFNKLNNLLIMKEINKDRIAVYHLIRSPQGTIMNSDMEVTDDGINDANFQDVSEKLYYERLNYLEDNEA